LYAAPLELDELEPLPGWEQWPLLGELGVVLGVVGVVVPGVARVLPDVVVPGEVVVPPLEAHAVPTPTIAATAIAATR
jgi:hypothetical protein